MAARSSSRHTRTGLPLQARRERPRARAGVLRFSLVCARGEVSFVRRGCSISVSYGLRLIDVPVLIIVYQTRVRKLDEEKGEYAERDRRYRVMGICMHGGWLYHSCRRQTSVVRGAQALHADELASNRWLAYRR